MFDKEDRIKPLPNEILAGANLYAVIEQNDRLVLFAHTFQVWSTGCGFTLSLLLSPSFAADARPPQVDFRGHAPPGEEESVAIVAVIFSDGRRVSNRPSRKEPGLRLTGGAGWRGHHTGIFAFAGLPPAPHLTLAVDWAGGNLSTSTHVALRRRTW